MSNDFENHDPPGGAGPDLAASLPGSAPTAAPARGSDTSPTAQRDDFADNGDDPGGVQMPRMSSNSDNDANVAAAERAAVPTVDVDDDHFPHRTDAQLAAVGAPVPVTLLWDPSNLAATTVAMLAVMAAGPRQYFVRRDLPGYVGRRGAEQDSNPAQFIELTPDLLTLFLSELVRFRQKQDNGKYKWIGIPPLVVRAIVARPTFPFQPLKRVIGTPVPLPSGDVVDRPGYHPASGLYLEPEPGLVVPPIPAHPTQQQVADARDLIVEVFCDTLFADREVDLSAAVAMMLTAIGRPAIDGCTPVFVVDAASPGTGKTELVQLVSVFSTGRPVEAQTAPNNDEEMRKRLTGLLLAGAKIILIDNVKNALIGGSAVEGFVSASGWSDRIVGTSKIFTGSVDALLFYTANHAKFEDDVLRRLVVVQLSTELEHVAERPLHRDAREWVLANRGRLIAAALTIFRAHAVAGFPDMGLTPMRGFDQWNQRIRAAVVWAGLADPLKNLGRYKVDASLNRDALGIALGLLERVFPAEQRFTAKDLFEALCEAPGTNPGGADIELLAEAIKIVIGDDPIKVGRVAFPHRIGRLTGQTVGGLHMRRVANGAKGNVYKIARITGK